ncbi:MAG: hypothetical protein ABIJ96_11915 [Elusimicrobiota bacterium]
MPEKRVFPPYAAFLALALFVVLLRLPDIFTHFKDWDEAAMMSQAWALTRGQILYRDIFQLHAVLNIALFVPFFLLFSPDAAPHAIKLFNAVLIFGGALAVRRAAVKWLASPALALLTAFLFAACFRWGWAQSSHGEFYALLPTLWAAHILLFSKDLSPRRLFAAGLLGGVAFYLKQTALFDTAALWAIALHRSRPGRRAATAAALAGGFAAVTAVITLYFAAHGAGKTALYSIWARPVLNYAGRATGRLRLVGTIAHAYAGYFSLMFAAAAAGAYALIRRRGAALSDGDRIFIYLALWLAADLCGLILGGRFYPHYLIQLIPATVLLSVHVLRGLHVRLQATAARAFIAIALIFGLHDAAGRLASLSAAGWRTPQVAQSQAAADYVRAHTRPQDRIFVYKAENLDIFYLARRLSSNGIYMFIDMVAEHTHDAATEERKRQELLAAPPAAIIVDPRGLRFASAETFFADIIKKHYQPAATISGLRIYLRNGLEDPS